MRSLLQQEYCGSSLRGPGGRLMTPEETPTSQPEPGAATGSLKPPAPESPPTLGARIAYAGFRYADLMIRDELHEPPQREELSRRIASQLPLLVMFAGAPFERTYI